MEDMTPEKSLDLLNNGRIAHIGVIDDDEPYVSPVSYVIVDQELCFRTAPGRRIRAIRGHPVIGFETTRTTESGGWECVVARGEAYEVTDPHQAQTVVSALLQKYAAEIGSPLSSGARGPINEEMVIVAARLSEISGRTSGTWFSIPMRPGRL
jgi:nitroimidazol reductase NimA-like FMN-containing flavoprotein (pyridoxamine 5'-phosphate oxidase superfamily)